MKKLLFSAMTLALLAGCSNTETDNLVDGNPLQIKLNAGVQAIGSATRAPITGIATFKPTILGWESSAVVDYTTDPSWEASTQDGIAANASNAAIILDPAQYYSADQTTKTYMKAFYAEGAVADTENSYIYNFANDKGAVDVLVAPVVEGSRTNATGKNFAFVHPLTQLKFEVKAGKGFPVNATLTSITLKNVALPTSFNFSTDQVGYAAKANLAVDGVTGTISDIFAPVGNPVMVEPIPAGADALTIDVVANETTYSNIKVELAATTSTGIGVAYTIQLTFQEKISASASVTEWEAGTGSGTVE